MTKKKDFYYRHLGHDILLSSRTNRKIASLHTFWVNSWQDKNTVLSTTLTTFKHKKVIEEPIEIKTSGTQFIIYNFLLTRGSKLAISRHSPVAFFPLRLHVWLRQCNVTYEWGNCVPATRQGYSCCNYFIHRHTPSTWALKSMRRPNSSVCLESKQNSR